MTNPQKLLEAWKSLKQKLISTLSHLKTRTNPTILNLENQFLNKLSEIKTKEQQLNDLPPPPSEPVAIGGGREPSQNDPYAQQRGNLSRQISELNEQKDALSQQLENIHPFLRNLNHQLTDKDSLIKQLNEHLYQKREVEQGDYEKQLKIMTDKWNSSEKKLDKVRDLIAIGNLNKLKQLLKEGKI